MLNNLSNMVVTRTPLRVSFVGGGTDFPEFYNNNEKGSVISLALAKYIHVVVKKHEKIFNEKYRISYSQTEVVDNINKIKNNIIRECLRFSDIQESVFVSTFSDIPAASGLGSSSSLAVGLLNALHAFKRENVTRYQLAEEACEIEINVLRQPIGKQDQYAATFGGLNRYDFFKDGKVSISGLNLKKGYLSNIIDSASLFWTGLTRNVESILAEQKTNLKKNSKVEIDDIYSLVDIFSQHLELKKPIKSLASIIDHSWDLKKQLSSTITNLAIEEMYKKAINAGAYGGKICGGGGGGFLLLFHPKNKRKKISEACNAEFSIPLSIDFSGTEILLNG